MLPTTSGEIVDTQTMDKTHLQLAKLEKFIGNTPVIEIFYTLDDVESSVYAKYEAWNYTGSVKDRMAINIIKNAYQVGSLKEHDTIVEATSGNTGIAFAAMGAYLGHPVHIYMPDWLSEERKRILRFYGAKLFEISAKQGGFQHCVDLAAKKSAKKGFFGPKQFDNAWNVHAHMSMTAPEFAKDLKDHNIDKIDVFVAGAGTGGTIMGFYRYFSPLNGDFKAVPVFPTKNTDGGHRIEGIGDSFVPKILSLSELEPVIRVSDSHAMNIARQINKLGLSVGISSGANVFAAICAGEKYGNNKTIATILCDDNKKYLSTDLCSETTENLSKEIKITDYKMLT